MQTGDFVLVDFVGKIKDNNQIFDLTREDVAKSSGIFRPDFRYGPIPVIVDAGLILKGIDGTLKLMNVGEKRTVEILPEDGFGHRKDDLVKMVPPSVFRENDIEPRSGNIVRLNNLSGKVLSNDGGRIKVDFNHPLAGKKLEYEIEIKSQLSVPQEKIKAIVSYFTSLQFELIDAEVKEKEADIILKKKGDLPVATKQAIADTIVKWMGPIEKVRFIEIYGDKNIYL